MGTYNKEIGRKLNDILELVYDEEQEFGKAAEECTARGLANWFNQRALDRRRFAEQLQYEIRSYGGEYKVKGTIAGDVQRVWMNIKAYFSKDNDKAMLEEIIKREKSTLKEYRDILQESDLPPSIVAMLTSHMAQMEYGLILLNNLENLEFDRT